MKRPMSRILLSVGTVIVILSMLLSTVSLAATPARPAATDTQAPLQGPGVAGIQLNLSPSGAGPYPPGTLFSVSGQWWWAGNQCWTSGSRFHYWVYVHEDMDADGDLDKDDISLVLQDNQPAKVGPEDNPQVTPLAYVIPAPCHEYWDDSAGPPTDGQNQGGQDQWVPWPAITQTANIDLTFTGSDLGLGTHKICAAVAHVVGQGADAASSVCLPYDIVICGLSAATLTNDGPATLPDSEIAFTATVTGTAVGTLSYGWDFDNDGTVDQTTSTNTTTHNYGGAGSWTAKVTVTDLGITGGSCAVSGTSEVTINPAPTYPDLAISKTDNPDPVQSGGTITYTIGLNNIGNAVAMDVVVTDTLPIGVTYVSDTDTCVEGPVGTLVCSLPNIPAAGNTSFDVVVTAPTVSVSTIITNTVEVYTPNDSDTSNNTDQEETTVNPLPPVCGLDSVTLTSDSPAILPDSTIAFTATITGTAVGTLSYKWDFDNNGSVDQTTSTNTTTHDYAGVFHGQAKVTVVDDYFEAYSCSVNDTTPVDVNPAPPTCQLTAVNLTSDSPATLPDSTIAFTATITGTAVGTLSYEWDFDNNGSIDQTTPTNTTTHDYLGVFHGQAKVTVVDTYFEVEPCSVNDTTPVDVNPAPPTCQLSGVVLSSDSPASLPDSTIAFTATITGTAVGTLSYKWDFDNNGSIDQTTPTNTTTHDYLGVFHGQAKVTVVDQAFEGYTCSANDTTPVDVNPAPPVCQLTGVNLTSDSPATLPDSTIAFTATITGTAVGTLSYKWDFDNNGSIDQSTSTNTTTHNYGGAGTWLARVTVVDTYFEVEPCSVTDTDQVTIYAAPALTVIKHVITDDGGTAVASNFTMTISGVTVVGTASFAGAESPGTTRQVYPGTYNVTETGPAGYTDSYSNCTGNIALGETKTCTITNNDQAAYLIVIKHVINDNGGTATASNFTMTISGVTVVGTASFPGAESPGITRQVYPGTYNVTETGPAGYSASYSAGCSGTIALGQTKTCTITNNDIPPTITLSADAHAFCSAWWVDFYSNVTAQYYVRVNLDGHTEFEESGTFIGNKSLHGDWHLGGTDIRIMRMTYWVKVGDQQVGDDETWTRDCGTPPPPPPPPPPPTPTPTPFIEILEVERLPVTGAVEPSGPFGAPWLSAIGLLLIASGGILHWLKKRE